MEQGLCGAVVGRGYLGVSLIEKCQGVDVRDKPALASCVAAVLNT